jgi:hypothetical protein
MTELVDAASDREVTMVSLFNEDKQTKVVIELDGLKKKDFYATNLYLTGSTNWYNEGKGVCVLTCA